MVDMDIHGFEKVIDGCITEKGLEKTIIQVIFPFLEKIGMLWITNHINPAQEHLVSNVIRQKLIAGIEATPQPVTVKDTILMFLPEGEHHEIGLLFMHFLLKIKGYLIYYIGANVPLKDVMTVASIKKPGYLFTHLTTVPKKFNLEKYLSQLKAKTDSTIVLSGTISKQYFKPLPPKVLLAQSLPQALSILSGGHIV